MEANNKKECTFHKEGFRLRIKRCGVERSDFALGSIPLIYISTKHQLIGYFISIFSRYFSLKIYSITTAIKEIFKKNYRKNLAPKFTRLINPWYLINFKH